eukprot:CAMPEP_0115264688 /NCGR_PEP_ID=MMETSP0270-20121206/50563_1 /TAXON_ID=71861 /ORGANISM="Scrippsiella trochoidea, Strain CCMP3099" /LENGTH=48 /DNA_ID= /DNA_START= /DNA_END= /DNA_ORIENTATION=
MAPAGTATVMIRGVAETTAGAAHATCGEGPPAGTVMMMRALECLLPWK